MSEALRIKQITQTTLGFPSQWEGLTECGQFVHICHRYGRLCVHLTDKEENLFTPQDEIIFSHDRGGYGDGEISTKEMIEITKGVLNFENSSITELDDPDRANVKANPVLKGEMK